MLDWNDVDFTACHTVGLILPPDTIFVYITPDMNRHVNSNQRPFAYISTGCSLEHIHKKDKERSQFLKLFYISFYTGLDSKHLHPNTPTRISHLKHLKIFISFNKFNAQF